MADFKLAIAITVGLIAADIARWAARRSVTLWAWLRTRCRDLKIALWRRRRKRRLLAAQAVITGDPRMPVVFGEPTGNWKWVEQKKELLDGTEIVVSTYDVEDEVVWRVKTYQAGAFVDLDGKWREFTDPEAAIAYIDELVVF